MSKKWKPGFGDAYYYVDNTCSVDIERYDGHTWDDERIAAGNCFNTKDDAHAAAEKVKALLLSLHSEPVADRNQLPKLTVDVFNRPDCPEWAKYAVLGGGGTLIFYEDKPMMSKDEYLKRWINYERWCLIEGTKFDASDWQNSLIGRPAKLPDWCKVGEWVYYRGYRKIIEVNALRLVLKSAHCDNLTVYPEEIGKEVKQARRRPYNAEEIPDLPFEVSERNSNFRTTVVSCKGNNVWLGGASTAISTEELMRDFTAKGEPCGVLEHLEDGEWVK